MSAALPPELLPVALALATLSPTEPTLTGVCALARRCALLPGADPPQTFEIARALLTDALLSTLSTKVAH